jgi:hypothetical protein
MPRQMPDPFSWADGLLYVGRFKIGSFSGDHLELMAVLRDDSVEMRHGDPTGSEMIVEMPGRHVIDRLDLLGVDEAAALTAYEAWRSRKIARYEDDMRPHDEEASLDPVRRPIRLSAASAREYRDALLELDCRTWITRTRSTAATAGPELDGIRVGPEPENFWWLLSVVVGSTGVDNIVMRLRLVLLVFPDEQVTVRIRIPETGLIARSLERSPSAALRTMQNVGAVYSPTVVLTEGRTDAEFLRGALSLLYPHLDDLVRFMDFEGSAKPEGSASALVRTLHAFVAAGISNHLVAVFDNDSAAVDAMRALGSDLPKNVAVMRYPYLDLAASYPTYGPPSSDSPQGVLSTADVNGLAGSIELYLGHDVLTRPDGQLRPVQWRAFVRGVQRYQGEITDKGEIQMLFRSKLERAWKEGGHLPDQDWAGMDLILREILAAHAGMRGPLRAAVEPE